MSICIPMEKDRVSLARAELRDKVDVLLFDAYIPEAARGEIVDKIEEYLSRELVVGGLGKFAPVRARNSAEPECLSSKQEVAGSNPAGPTKLDPRKCYHDGPIDLNEQGRPICTDCGVPLQWVQAKQFSRLAKRLE